MPVEGGELGGVKHLDLIVPTKRRMASGLSGKASLYGIPIFDALVKAQVAMGDDAEVFENWRFTPGGFGGGIPMPYNKQQFIVGLPEGLPVHSE